MDAREVWSGASMAEPAARALSVHRTGYPSVTIGLEPGVRYTFGRTEQARILFPDVRVSRTHGELEVHQGAWMFSDLGSANGSYLFRVDDLVHTQVMGGDLPCVRLTPGRRGRLRIGDGILLGCRDAWIELRGPNAAVALGSLDAVNPKDVVAYLRGPGPGSAPTPDLPWTPREGEPVALAGRALERPKPPPVPPALKTP